MSIIHDLGKDTVTMVSELPLGLALCLLYHPAHTCMHTQTRHRDLESKELSKAERNQRCITNDVRTRESEIGDHRKRIAELQIQLKDFAAAYEVSAYNVQHDMMMHHNCNEQTLWFSSYIANFEDP